MIIFELNVCLHLQIYGFISEITIFFMRFFVKMAIFSPFNKLYAAFLCHFARYFVISQQIFETEV